MSRRRAKARATYTAWATARHKVWVPSLGWISEREAFEIHYQFRKYIKARRLEPWNRQHGRWGFADANKSKFRRLEMVYPFFRGLFERLER